MFTVTIIIAFYSNSVHEGNYGMKNFAHFCFSSSSKENSEIYISNTHKMKSLLTKHDIEN